MVWTSNSKDIITSAPRIANKNGPVFGEKKNCIACVPLRVQISKFRLPKKLAERSRFGVGSSKVWPAFFCVFVLWAKGVDHFESSEEVFCAVRISFCEEVH